jgi:hypothetical protein
VEHNDENYQRMLDNRDHNYKAKTTTTNIDNAIIMRVGKWLMPMAVVDLTNHKPI